MEVLDGLTEEVKKKRMANQANFEAAVTAFQATDFRLANKLFTNYLKDDPEDPVAALLLKYCSNTDVTQR